MPDILTADERAAIAAYPESRVQRIPRGVSGEATYIWVEGAGKGQINECLRADRPTGWKVGMVASHKRRAQREKFQQARQAVNDRARARREERFPRVLELIGRGLSTRAIAEKMGLSQSSIRDDMATLRDQGRL